MATLLTMVNDLRVLLREEQVAAISSTDDLTQALVSLIDRAVRDVLENQLWSFDKRYDGFCFFPARITGTGYTAATNRITITYSLATALAVSDRNFAWRIRVTNDDTYPGVSYRIGTVDTTAYAPDLTLYTPDIYYGELGTEADATWELYSNEYVLPSTVFRVFSVIHEDSPQQLYFYENEIFGDRFHPRPTDESGDPDGVHIGGTVTSTYNTDTHTAGVTGTRMEVHPVPDDGERKLLRYTYSYRHPAMTAAADTLTGVPDRIIRLIVDRAFYYCLASNIEADPVRAAHALKQYRIDLELAHRADNQMPNRRRVMRPFGMGLGRHPNSRWEDREVPSP